MITAAEAVKLYDESGHEVDQFLEQTVKPVIISAAKSGKRMAYVHLGTIKPHRYIHQTVTPLQQAAVDKLIKLGFLADIRLNDEPYVPRGLADDDGNGPLYKNYGISIRW